MSGGGSVTTTLRQPRTLFTSAVDDRWWTLPEADRTAILDWLEASGVERAGSCVTAELTAEGEVRCERLAGFDGSTCEIVTETVVAHPFYIPDCWPL